MVVTTGEMQSPGHEGLAVIRNDRGAREIIKRKERIMVTTKARNRKAEG